ncbi:uncharacterized protein [Palaemon carinicauda]|uniref:uncharacterized protein n=1 Tax=Palaemon carinicauda TaxID=392227 RepID=UPI0035B5A274
MTVTYCKEMLSLQIYSHGSQDESTNEFPMDVRPLVGINSCRKSRLLKSLGHSLACIIFITTPPSGIIKFQPGVFSTLTSLDLACLIIIFALQVIFYGRHYMKAQEIVQFNTSCYSGSQTISCAAQ